MSILVKDEKNQFIEIVLSRPSLRNAFDPEMIQKITEVFQKISNEPQWRAIIVRGEGKVFCAGADLNWMESMVKFSYVENEADAIKLFQMFEAIEQCPHPVVCVVHGAAMGGAIGVMAASDIVIAEKNTQFCFSEVKLGIVPAVISAFVLKTRSSAQIAPWMMSGKIFTSVQALNMGLVTEQFSSENRNELEQLLGSWKSAFVDAAPEAVCITKDLIKKVTGASWSMQKTLTTQVIADRRVSNEGQEGLKSFLNKTTPSWRKS
jgi:methylglutaconyl-CoA hydratase